MTTAVRYHGVPLASSTPQNSKYWLPAGKRPDPVNGATAAPLAAIAAEPNHVPMLEV